MAAVVGLRGADVKDFVGDRFVFAIMAAPVLICRDGVEVDIAIFAVPGTAGSCLVVNGWITT